MMIGESAASDGAVGVENEGEEEWMTCGTCVLTIFGHGVIIKRHSVPGDRKYCMFSVRIWGPCSERGSSIAYLNPMAIISRAPACPGLVVRTPFDGLCDVPVSRVLSVSRSYSDDRPAIVTVQLPFGIGYLNASSVKCNVSRVMPLVETMIFVAKRHFHDIASKALLVTTPIHAASSSAEKCSPIPEQLASSYNVDIQHKQTGMAELIPVSKFDFKSQTAPLRRLNETLKQLTGYCISTDTCEEEEIPRDSVPPLNLVEIIEKTQNMWRNLSSNVNKLDKCAQEDICANLMKVTNASTMQKAVSLLDNILKFLDGNPLEEDSNTLLRATETAFLWWIEAVVDENEPPLASELVEQFEEGTLANTVTRSILKRAETQRKVVAPAIEGLLEYLKSEEGETTVASVVEDGFKHIRSLPSLQSSFVTRDFLARIGDGEDLAKSITSSVSMMGASQLMDIGERALNDGAEWNQFMNQVKDQAFSFFVRCLPTWTVPAIHGKSQGFLYSIKNLNMDGFKVSPEDILVEYRGPAQGFFIRVRDINAELKGIEWSCQQPSLPKIKVEGVAHAMVHGVHIEISLGLRQSSQEQRSTFLCVLSHRSVSMRSLNINVETNRKSMQWVINKITSIFESAIRVHVCNSLGNAIQKHVASPLRPLNNYCSTLHSDVLKWANIRLNDLPVATEMEEFLANGGVKDEVQRAYEASGLKFLNVKFKSLCFIEEGPLGLVVETFKDSMELDHDILVIIDVHEGSHAAQILGTGIDDVLGSEIISCNGTTLSTHDKDAVHILKDMPRPVKLLLRCFEIPSYKLNTDIPNELSGIKNEQAQPYVVTFNEQSLGLSFQSQNGLDEQEELVTVKGFLRVDGAAKAYGKVKVGDILTHINGSPVEKKFKSVMDSLHTAGRPFKLAFAVPSELDIHMLHPPLDLEIAYTRGSVFVVALHRVLSKRTAALKKGDILHKAVGRDGIKSSLRFDASSFPLRLYFHREGTQLPPVEFPSARSFCLDLVMEGTRCVLRSIRPLSGPAARTGMFYPGQVILSVGTIPVRGPAQWKTAMSSKHNWPGSIRVLNVRLKIQSGLQGSNSLAAAIADEHR